ncbi:MAG: mercury(II) reductase [Anaerolineales bacterium]|jgi:mercuric reductase|nr:mercury(II) reductase [Anaerolineales bacterium]UYN91623.1 MAG: mercury(II) reductase [Anaerolineales bacterium]
MAQYKKLDLDVRGMTCATCPNHVERALSQVEGVKSVDIPNWQSSKATVIAEAEVSEEALTASVERAGYHARVKTVSIVDDNVEQSGSTFSNGHGENNFDLLVIGAGSAGFAAAIKGADLGFRVGMVGHGTIGGTCVNRGCVPSKTLIRAAEAWHNAGHHPFKGINTQQGNLDWETVRSQKDELISQMRQSRYADVLAAYPNITYIEGFAQFTEGGKVQVGDTLYKANRYVIATGAQPRMVNFPGIEEAEPLNSTTLMELEQLPKSLIILGGRAVALELGQTMARLGVNVLILQRSTRLVPDHEPEIGRAIKDYLEQEGVSVITGVEVGRLSQDGDTRSVHARVLGQEREFKADQILMALGREANTKGMGLENRDVELEQNGAIVVDRYMQSSNPAIYATGDVTTNPEFVYVAAAGGSIAAQNALTDTKKPLDLSTVPGVIFTDPQIATVGLTEAQAKIEGIKVKTSTVSLEYVARAQAARDTRGFIKLVADETTNRLLGAHILAAEAGEVIQSATLAIKFGLKVDDLTDTLFPYLTQVEGLKLAAIAFEKDVAMLSCCVA